MLCIRVFLLVYVVLRIGNWELGIGLTEPIYGCGGGAGGNVYNKGGGGCVFRSAVGKGGGVCRFVVERW